MPHLHNVVYDNVRPRRRQWCIRVLANSHCDVLCALCHFFVPSPVPFHPKYVSMWLSVLCVCVCIVEAERATGSCGAASTNNAVAMMCLPTACKNKQTYLFYINSFTNVYSVLLL